MNGENIVKKNAMQNAQSGNPDWNLEMLLGEGQFEGNTRQIDYPVGAFAQVAIVARKAWMQLPTRGEDSVSLTRIQQGLEEPFQSFMARLQQVTSRTLGSSYSEGLLITQLAFENANPTCRAVLLLHKGQIDLSRCIRLCADIRPTFN